MSGFGFSLHYTETSVLMRTYNDYINDPYFMKWVFQPDGATEKYWANYMENNPDEKKLLLYVREELCNLKLKNKELTGYEKNLLFQKILKKKNQQSVIIRFRHYSKKVLPYAAVAFLFLLTGSVLMYFYLDGRFTKDRINYAALEYTSPAGAPRLILSDGTDVPLKKNSTVKCFSREVVADNKNVKISSGSSNEPVPNQLIVPSGNRSKITLSDNTVVYLNAGSKLIYPSVFKKDTREVLLFGEAFFEVAKNKHQPFIVKTSSIDIEVLGTHFDVSAYSDDNQVQTVLVEGAVAVKKHDASVFNRKVLLKPNQMLVFSKQTKNMVVNNVDAEYYTLWKDGMLKFEGEELKQVIKKIERFYDLKIAFDDPSKGEMKISGKLSLTGNPADVINYLSVLTKMNFEKTNEESYVLK